MSDKKIIGAYVKDINPGVYKNVCVFDITSSYPNQIIHCNISPETYIPEIPEDLRYILTERLEDHLIRPPKIQSELDDILRKVFFDLDWFEEKVTPYLKANDLILTANLTLFRKDKIGSFARLTKITFENRKKWKRIYQALERLYGLLEKGEISQENLKNEIKKLIETYQENFEIVAFLKELLSNERITKEKLHDFMTTADLIQYALKVEINAFYGAFSNTGFMFFEKNMAQTITAMGQLCIRGVANEIEKRIKGCVNIYNDTDSCFLMFPEIENPYDILKKEEEINKVINDYFDRLTEVLNLTERRIFMEMETVSDISIFMAKKKYIMKLIWKEGVEYDKDEKPYHYKIKGFDVIKSSTPEFARERLEKVIDMTFDYLMGKSDLNIIRKYLQDEYRNFLKAPVEDIAFARQVNNIGKFLSNSGLYKKGTPVHVKGAIIYNRLVDILNLPVDKIYDGDKIKWLYVHEDGKYKTNSIAFKHFMPKEILREFKIDYEKQYQMGMLAPLEPLFKAVGCLDKISLETEKLMSQKRNRLF